jgi:hypothetical protein
LITLGLALAGFSTGAAWAGTLLVGSNAASPDQVQLTTETAVVLNLIGPHNASAAAIDGSGNTFFAIPGDTSSTVQEYDPSRNLIGSFLFVAAPSDTRDSASYIEDMGWGLGGWLWLSTFSGNVYAVSESGAIHSFFDTGTSSPGVTTDGTYLYTTQGFGFVDPAPNIYQRDADGNVLNTIDTGLNDTLGIGFDSVSRTFWIGGFDSLSNVDLQGNILNQFANDGVHTGLEVNAPEPATIFLSGLAIVLFFALRGRRTERGWRPLGAAVSTPAINSSLTSPQPIGTTITFTASATDSDPGPIRYRFRTRPAAGTFALVRDFSVTATLAWTPNDTDGLFEIEVTAQNTATNSTAVASETFQVTPLATGSAPTVNSTSHPLVALYSAPACAAGSSMRVRFQLVGDVAWQSTNLKPCGSGTMNFYIGGMRASSTYQLRHDVIHGAQITTGPTLRFTTGPVAIPLPAVTQVTPLHSPTSLTDGVTLFAVLRNVSPFPTFAVDSAANVIWYSTVVSPYVTRPVPGGTFLQLFGYTKDLSNSGFRETDLVGNLVRETNVERLNAQLALMGRQPVTVVHHEVRRLANGNYLALAQTERMSTAQGPLTDIAGDAILVLDSNLQILWAWDSFDYLDVTRKAVLNETCTVPGCILFNASVANDWTHGNSASLTPDGNILYSSRHQDLVYKIAYNNGAGDGHVIWKLGKDGDFAWQSSDPYPWQSHQHDAAFQSPTVLSIFDDGDTRVGQFGGNSRGQVLTIDEVNLTITPIFLTDLGAYSAALGSAQRLSNGNYEFLSGSIREPSGRNETDSVETTSAGSITSLLHCAAGNYRAFRLRDLYSAQ